MIKNIEDIIPKEFKNFKIINIRNEASRRKYYRLKKDKKSVVLMDSSKEPKQFDNFLKVHKIISNIKISIPTIYEIDKINKIIILEDLGNLRFDKILNKYKLKDLLFIAVESLIEIKRQLDLIKTIICLIMIIIYLKKNYLNLLIFFIPTSKRKK